MFSFKFIFVYVWIKNINIEWIKLKNINIYYVPWISFYAEEEILILFYFMKNNTTYNTFIYFTISTFFISEFVFKRDIKQWLLL